MFIKPPLSFQNYTHIHIYIHIYMYIFCHSAEWCTYVYDIRQVMDVIFKHRGIGGLQSQQILISGLQSLQFVLRVFCLPLIRKKKTKKMKMLIFRTEKWYITYTRTHTHIYIHINKYTIYKCKPWYKGNFLFYFCTYIHVHTVNIRIYSITVQVDPIICIYCSWLWFP